MRFKREITPYQEWTRVFALVPHWCTDTNEFVWLEYIWRSLESSWYENWWIYRSARP